MSHEDRRPDENIGSGIEGSPFVQLLTPRSQVKILDVLLQKSHSSLAASQICELAEVSPSTFNRTIDDLTRVNIVIERDVVSGAQQYQINVDNPITQALLKFQFELLKQAEDMRSLRPEIHRQMDEIISETAASHTASERENSGQEIIGELQAQSV